MRTIEIVATTNGRHKVCIGMSDSEIASFKMKAWITHYGERAVDWVQNLSLGYVSFMGGNIWVHNSDSVDRCNLFGEQKDCIVGIVANQETGLVRILDSLEVHSNDEWEVESITIPASLNYPNGMYSKVPTARFRRREGVWTAEFLRNMLTSSGSISVIESVKGEPLRGESAFIRLKNTSTSQVKLLKVTINMTSSR